MNANNEIRNEVERNVEILDLFDHPVMSPAVAERIVGRMVREHRRGRVGRIWYRIVLPMAAAAILVLVGALFLSTNQPASKPINNSVITAVASENSSTQVDEVVQAVFVEWDLSEGQAVTDNTADLGSLLGEILEG